MWGLPAKTRARDLAPELLGLLLLYVAAVAFIRPWGNFSVTDDTYFGLPALDFGTTGSYRQTIAPHSLRAQIAWGGLFVRLFGPTWDSLRLASMASMVIAVFMLHAILRRLEVSRGVRIFATLAFAFHPLLLWSSNTFMTETHFICASVIAMYFYLRGLQEDSPLFLFCACAAVALSWWVRQMGILNAVTAPALLLLYRQHLTPRWKRALAICALPIAVFVLIFFVKPDLLIGYAPEFYGLTHMWRESTFRLPQQLALVRHYVFLTLLNTSLLFAPIILLGARSVLRRYTRRQAIVAAVVVLFFTYGVYELFRSHVAMPFSNTTLCCDLTGGNIFTNFGLGPPTLPGGMDDGPLSYPFRITWAWRVVITLAAGLCAVLLCVGAIAPLSESLREPRRGIGLLLAVGYTAVHTAGLCASAAYFDRYALDSAWPLVIVAALLVGARPLRAPAAILLVAFMLFGVFSVNEFYAWQRARWTAWFDLRHRGIAMSDIDGGGEPRDLYGGLAYEPNIHVRRRAAYNLGPKPPYEIAFVPPAGTRVVRRYPFRGWLGLHEGTVYVVERAR